MALYGCTSSARGTARSRSLGAPRPVPLRPPPKSESLNPGLWPRLDETCGARHFRGTFVRIKSAVVLSPAFSSISCNMIRTCEISSQRLGASVWPSICPKEKCLVANSMTGRGDSPTLCIPQGQNSHTIRSAEARVSAPPSKTPGSAPLRVDFHREGTGRPRAVV